MEIVFWSGEDQLRKKKKQNLTNQKSKLYNITKYEADREKNDRKKEVSNRRLMHHLGPRYWKWSKYYLKKKIASLTVH